MSQRRAAAAMGGMSKLQEAEEMAMELRRGPWTLEEDNLLMNYIACHGEGRWNLLARSSGLKRTGKSCRLRWLNYLKPDIKRGNLTPEEQLLILELHAKWGNRWSRIAQHLPGRTDNEIKNYWRTRVQKQARQLKVDANSDVFRDAVRCYWMPRLLEKMASTPHHEADQPLPMLPLQTTGHHHVDAMATAFSNHQQETTYAVPAATAGNGYHGQYYHHMDPSPSTSTSGSNAALPPVPCFSELRWEDMQSSSSGDLDGAAGVFDSSAMGSLGLDGLDLGPEAEYYSDDPTLLDYLMINSTCTGNGNGSAMMMLTGGAHGAINSYCAGGDVSTSTWRADELCQAARKHGEWGGGI